MCLLHKQSINFLGRISNNLDTMRISALISSQKAAPAADCSRGGFQTSRSAFGEIYSAVIWIVFFSGITPSSSVKVTL